MNDALFRIGGTYRDQQGRPVTLERLIHVDWHGGVDCAVAVYAERPLTGAGWKRITDGRYVHALDNDQHGCHLIPGELTQRDGQWVPMEEAKEEAAERQLDALADAVNAAMIARDECCHGIERMFASNVPAAAAPVSTAKPAIAALTRSPDLTEARHQVCPDHALAAGLSLRKSVR